MKFSSQEEFGLRCLIQVAKHQDLGGVTIQQISEIERLTVPNVAKLLRILRMGGFIESTRGQIGGYTLSRPANEIKISDVLETLGGRLFEPGFCNDFSGLDKVCIHNLDCSIRTLWLRIQNAVDQAILNLTLQDLYIQEEKKVSKTDPKLSSVRL